MAGDGAGDGASEDAADAGWLLERCGFSTPPPVRAADRGCLRLISMITWSFHHNAKG